MNTRQYSVRYTTAVHSCTYTKHSYQLTPAGLELRFEYVIAGHHLTQHNSGAPLSFHTTLLFEQVTQEQLNSIPPAELEHYLLAIGMAELLSYWKITIAPEIVIAAGHLDQEQLAWWHKLLINGMGEFFYVNNIDFTASDFVQLRSTGQKNTTITSGNSKEATQHKSVSRILIPIGGGKDSAVTLELLRGHYPIAGYMLEPIESAQATLQAARTPVPAVVARRTLDPQIKTLNASGGYNGHVPISAVFAFTGLLAARLFDYSHVALSNENSSNEANVVFHNRNINHQYSKTFEFESDLRQYCAAWLPADCPEYFSFLRPLYEIQIAQLFAAMPQYHAVFRSCNRGQKTNEWCCNCPKCLFAYTVLYPFIPDLQTHFGADLFENEALWPTAQELLGITEVKPFECVGTRAETLLAFHLAIKKLRRQELELPVLLEKVTQTELYMQTDFSLIRFSVLYTWNEAHALPPELTELLRKTYWALVGVI